MGEMNMKRWIAFAWTIWFAVGAVAAILMMNLLPLHGFEASSLPIALQELYRRDPSETIPKIAFYYVIIWFTYLLVCCVLSFRGAILPTAIALGADLMFALGFILYELIAGDARFAEYIPYWIGGFVLRLLYLIGGLAYFRFEQWAEQEVQKTGQ